MKKAIQKRFQLCLFTVHHPHVLRTYGIIEPYIYRTRDDEFRFFHIHISVKWQHKRKEPPSYSDALVVGCRLFIQRLPTFHFRCESLIIQYGTVRSRYHCHSVIASLHPGFGETIPIQGLRYFSIQNLKKKKSFQWNRSQSTRFKTCEVLL